MAGTGDKGNPQLERAQRLLLDAMTIQLQRMIEKTMRNSMDRRRRRGHKDEYREDRIKRVKIQIPSFKGKSDPEAYL